MRGAQRLSLNRVRGAEVSRRLGEVVEPAVEHSEVVVDDGGVRVVGAELRLGQGERRLERSSSVGVAIEIEKHVPEVDRAHEARSRVGLLGEVLRPASERLRAPELVRRPQHARRLRQEARGARRRRVETRRQLTGLFAVVARRRVIAHGEAGRGQIDPRFEDGLQVGPRFLQRRESSLERGAGLGVSAETGEGPSLVALRTTEIEADMSRRLGRVFRREVVSASGEVGEGFVVLGGSVERPPVVERANRGEVVGAESLPDDLQPPLVRLRGAREATDPVEQHAVPLVEDGQCLGALPEFGGRVDEHRLRVGDRPVDLLTGRELRGRPPPKRELERPRLPSERRVHRVRLTRGELGLDHGVLVVQPVVVLGQNSAVAVAQNQVAVRDERLQADVVAAGLRHDQSGGDRAERLARRRRRDGRVVFRERPEQRGLDVECRREGEESRYEMSTNHRRPFAAIGSAPA